MRLHCFDAIGGHIAIDHPAKNIASVVGGGTVSFEIVNTRRYDRAHMIEDLDGDLGMDNRHRKRFPVQPCVSPSAFFKTLSG